MTRWTADQLAAHQARATPGPGVLLPYPISVNRYWTIDARSRRIVPTREGREWKANARSVMVMARPALSEGPVAVNVVLHPRQRKDGGANEARMDLDNALKAALDAMQGVFFANDRQVHAIYASIGDPRPDGGMTVAVEAIDG